MYKYRPCLTGEFSRKGWPKVGGKLTDPNPPVTSGPTNRGTSFPLDLRTTRRHPPRKGHFEVWLDETGPSHQMAARGDAQAAECKPHQPRV
jgi:hypothetical protein